MLKIEERFESMTDIWRSLCLLVLSFQNTHSSLCKCNFATPWPHMGNSPLLSPPQSLRQPKTNSLVSCVKHSARGFLQSTWKKNLSTENYHSWQANHYYCRDEFFFNLNLLATIPHTGKDKWEKKNSLSGQQDFAKTKDLWNQRKMLWLVGDKHFLPWLFPGFNNNLFLNIQKHFTEHSSTVFRPPASLVQSLSYISHRFTFVQGSTAPFSSEIQNCSTAVAEDWKTPCQKSHQIMASFTAHQLQNCLNWKTPLGITIVQSSCSSCNN